MLQHFLTWVFQEDLLSISEKGKRFHDASQVRNLQNPLQKVNTQKEVTRRAVTFKSWHEVWEHPDNSPLQDAAQFELYEADWDADDQQQSVIRHQK